MDWQKERIEKRNCKKEYDGRLAGLVGVVWQTISENKDKKKKEKYKKKISKKKMMEGWQGS